MQQFVVDEKSGCWNWLLAKQSRGYGETWDRSTKKIELAHRFAYKNHHGIDEIPKGLVVHHTCNNRLCVNPEHLALISNRHNIRLSPKSRLNPEAVAGIRAAVTSGRSYRDVAKEFGVHHGTVYQVVKRKIWAND